ncbi:MMPL family transporter [Streptomyces cacaoi]|uniref:MMPL family transporter n=1 Tax=Streptomyces cacaoi TaxID=1898 RepID=UPI0011F21AFC|nr:MMPL family transporter [Streptomyces cacaoi]
MPANSPFSQENSALTRWAARVHAGPRHLLGGLAAVVLLLAALGAGIGAPFSSDGYDPDGADSVRAEAFLDRHLRAGTPDLVVLARAPGGVDDASTQQAGTRLTRKAEQLSGVRSARSYWTTGDRSFRSRDGRSGLLVLRLRGDQRAAQTVAEQVVPELRKESGAFRLRVTGPAQVAREAEDITGGDLVRAELIAAPVVVLLLLLVFRSVGAALLPVAVGVTAVTAAMALLRLLALVTPVSVFAQNLTTALGFGLAVDYSLFLLARYREETGQGAGPREALTTTVRTAGRTVLASAATVAVSAAGLLVFPTSFLRSLGYASVGVVGCAAVAALVAVPALLALCGPRLARPGRIERWYAARRRTGPAPRAAHEDRWYRTAMAVMRRPLTVTLLTTTLLVLAALPFTHARFGNFDDRMLPAGTPARQASEEVRRQFGDQAADPVFVALPGLRADAGGTAELDRYARRLSRAEGVARTETATGVYRSGKRAGDAAAAEGYAGPAGAWVRVLGVPGADSEGLVSRLRQVPVERTAWVGGPAALLSDTRSALAERLPWALAVLALGLVALMLPFTRSVLAPLKALALSALSLTASFGALVWIFQEGHLRGLVGDFPVTGFIECSLPALMLCVAFGLATDYELFVFSRIRERYDATGDSTHAIAWGLARSGRLVTASALTIACVFAAMGTSQMSQLKMVGVGTMLAVLVDATVVRVLLLPALMRLAGAANWWWPSRRKPPPGPDGPGPHEEVPAARADEPRMLDASGRAGSGG